LNCKTLDSRTRATFISRSITSAERDLDNYMRCREFLSDVSAYLSPRQLDFASFQGKSAERFSALSTSFHVRKIALCVSKRVSSRKAISSTRACRSRERSSKISLPGRSGVAWTLMCARWIGETKRGFELSGTEDSAHLSSRN